MFLQYTNVKFVHADTGVCIDPGAAGGGAAGRWRWDDTDAFSITPVFASRAACIPHLKPSAVYLKGIRWKRAQILASMRKSSANRVVEREMRCCRSQSGEITKATS